MGTKSQTVAALDFIICLRWNIHVAAIAYGILNRHDGWSKNFFVDLDKFL